MKPGWFPLSEPTAPFALSDAVVIDGPEQLARLQPPVRGSLASRFGVQGLADRICPVEREDGSVSLCARAEYVGSDQADALIRKMRDAGRRLSSPARYVLPAALVLSLSRESARPRPGAPGMERTPVALAGVFQDLVEWGVRRGATDLHLNVRQDCDVSEVRYTVGGRYVAPEGLSHMATDLMLDVLAVAWMDIQSGNGAVFDPLLEQQGYLSRRVDGRVVTLRWASLAADRGPCVCLRFLQRDAGSVHPDLSSLGYSAAQLAIFERVMCSEGGAIVLAGVVGSGKSTTLATLVRSLPDDRKIVTLEEPVEYRIERAVQNTISRDLGTLAHDRYGAKLRALKRAAMSDVLLGEIRDAESGLAFMDLVGSGVNVYTTVHAPSGHGIVDRLASSFIGVPRDFLLTPGVLKLLVYQVLLPRLCPHCAPCATPDELARQSVRDRRHWVRWMEWMGRLWSLDAACVRLRNPQGCEHCRIPHVPQLAGYRGRTVAAECLEPGLTISLTAAGGPAATHGAANAMAHAMEKVAGGLVDPRDVERRFLAFETLWLRAGHTK